MLKRCPVDGKMIFSKGCASLYVKHILSMRTHAYLIHILSVSCKYYN